MTKKDCKIFIFQNIYKKNLFKTKTSKKKIKFIQKK